METKPQSKIKKSQVVKKWVAALRSGKFRQAHNQLGENDGSRCCLGVLCEIAKQDGVIKSFSLACVYLPKKVRVWAGLRTISAEYGPRLRIKHDRKALWKDNDGVLTGKKASFKTIAKLIESRPEGLFE